MNLNLLLCFYALAHSRSTFIGAYRLIEGGCSLYCANLFLFQQK